MNPIITIDSVSKSYGTKVALNKVSFEINEGTILGLLGPNGAGKTTLIRIINQITIADEGKILFKGREIKTEDVISFGYLPEERGLYRKMKVGEQALYLSQLKGLNKKQALKELKYWFEKFEITSWWDKKVEELSKGMQQKVQFIISVLHRPSVLIFDEPFSGFDPINANIIKQELLEMKKNGTTIMLSTHNMASVEELCDEIVLINSAHNVLNGKVKDIKQQYKDNIFEIVFKGFVNYINIAHQSDYEILEAKQEDNYHIYKVKILNNNIKANNLLEAILSAGEIVSFKEILPSMDEIFIKVVQNTNYNYEKNTNNIV